MAGVTTGAEAAADTALGAAEETATAWREDADRLTAEVIRSRSEDAGAECCCTSGAATCTPAATDHSATTSGGRRLDPADLRGTATAGGTGAAGECVGAGAAAGRGAAVTGGGGAIEG